MDKITTANNDGTCAVCGDPIASDLFTLNSSACLRCCVAAVVGSIAPKAQIYNIWGKDVTTVNRRLQQAIEQSICQAYRDLGGAELRSYRFYKDNILDIVTALAVLTKVLHFPMPLPAQSAPLEGRE